MTPKRKDMKYWNIPVTPHLDEVLEKAVKWVMNSVKTSRYLTSVREVFSAILKLNELWEILEPYLSKEEYGLISKFNDSYKMCCTGGDGRINYYPIALFPAGY